ncbi:MAG: Ribosomal large subunit pseudouridine synthase B [Sodalis sp.]|nr:MAG: Ribosomal large subunit pseudouridine synthase B [Sodalis sp.]
MSVGGNVVTLGDRVEVTKTTKIRVDYRIITIKPLEDTLCRVLSHYKPEGALCARRDSEVWPTLFDLLPRLNNAR